jgi:hypothetical protein
MEVRMSFVRWSGCRNVAQRAFSFRLQRSAAYDANDREHVHDYASYEYDGTRVCYVFV